MSMFGFDVPCGRNQVAASRRKRIFDVIAPYVMSQEDIDTVASRPAYLRDLWLESFANAARTIQIADQDQGAIAQILSV